VNSWEAAGAIPYECLGFRNSSENRVAFVMRIETENIFVIVALVTIELLALRLV